MAYRDRSASPAGRAAAAVSATASKLWSFNRSRSSSPNPASYDQDYYNAPVDYNNRSRRSSEQPPETGSSFVIRSVVKKPGGVSLPSSPDGKPQASFAPHSQRGQESSPGRRMAIEDSDSDNDDPNAPSRLTYRRSRSKPLPAVMSLGVPPGGPGGGVGYGTARSFNDGRREPFHGEPAPRPKPQQQQQRSPSPGTTTARGFQQGLQDRGRSPRTSHSPAGRTESPSARKPVARITPGPQSLTQTQHQPPSPKQDPNRASISSGTRPQSMAGPRQFPGSPISTNQQARFSSSPMSAPSAGRIPPPDVFGGQQAERSHRDSQVAPAFDAGSESPFGTVSPGGHSPSFLSNFMAGDSSNDQPQSDAGGLAGKWLKGVFGRSPNDKQSYMADQRSDWARDPRPYIDDTEEQARAQKMESMRQAQQIVEQERAQRERERQLRPAESPRSGQEEFERASAEHEHERRKSPPGRKPIPVLSPSELEPQDGLSQLQSRLTPAQMIIQETRSRQMARDQIQAEREAAIRAQAAAPIRGPQTPIKDTGASPRQEERQRFPSGAHQIVRQTAEPVTPSRSPAAPAPKSAIAGPKRGDMSPGTGPMPLEMPLPQALQEMMERFYRFERYSVPLIRCLETRINEMERNEGLSAKRSQQPEQMRMWVGQITHLMKHEIGQLRAATQELKQGRELVADIARRHPPAEAPITTASVENQQPQQQQRQAPVEPVSPTPKRDVPTEAPNKTSFVPESAPREQEPEPVRSVSPGGGRPRYTSVLGQPLSQARLSPTPVPGPSRVDEGPSTSLSASSSEQGGFKREVSVENRLKALMEGARPTSSRSASSSVVDEEHHEEQWAPRHSQRDVSEREMDMPVSSTDDYCSANLWSSQWQSAPSSTASPSLAVRELPTAPTLDKTPSQSSCESSSVAEPLTPLTDHAPALHDQPEPSDNTAHEDKKDSSVNDSFHDYASETIKLKSFQYFDTDSVATTLSSTLKTSFDSPAATPTHAAALAPASPGISPNKLYAKRFPAPASPMSSNPSSPTKIFTAQLPPVSTTAHLGLVERKRFTLPATPASPVGGLGLTQSNSFNNNSNNSPAASVPMGPTSAAFSTARPIGHHATLKERVAFFDPRM